MCKGGLLHWHCKEDARKTLELINKHKDYVMKMIRGEKPIYEIGEGRLYESEIIQ